MNMLTVVFLSYSTCTSLAYTYMYIIAPQFRGPNKGPNTRQNCLVARTILPTRFDHLHVEERFLEKVHIEEFCIPVEK